MKYMSNSRTLGARLSTLAPRLTSVKKTGVNSIQPSTLIWCLIQGVLLRAYRMTFVTQVFATLVTLKQVLVTQVTVK